MIYTEAMEHEELTHKIIGCAMAVHNELGVGFPELVYQKALALEMQRIGINFIKEYSMEIHYKGTMIGTRRVDFFVEDLIMVEIKATSTLEDIHLAQAKNYLEVYKISNGLLINFGSTSLQFKRMFNNKTNNYKSLKGIEGSL